MKARSLMWVLWPSFLTSAAASLVVFTLIDPEGLSVFGHEVEMRREAFYTLVFFALWTITAVSSTITLYLAPNTVHEWGDGEAGS